VKKYKFTINGNTYDVEMDSIEDNLAKLEINGTPYEVEIHHEVKKSKTPTLLRPSVPKPDKSDIQKKGGGTTSSVAAPLPGSIISVDVKAGDIVKKDQRILVMEAMKMENNVLAEKDCVIEKILVSPGDTVLQGDALVEVL